MNWRNAGMVSVVLFVPIILVLLFKTGTTRLKELPVYGGKIWVNNDSADYSINLQDLVLLPESLQDRHIILYLSEDLDGELASNAQTNLLAFANRLLEARNHPVDQLTDLAVVSVSQSPFNTDRPDTWHQLRTRVDIDSFVKTALQNSFEFSEDPVKDHVAFLIDKDGRIRSQYFTGHGKFDRNIQGELVVLRTEYGR